MQDLWCGDKRDRVKWGTIVTLAREYSITSVNWIVYYRPFSGRTLHIDGQEIIMHEDVWKHFSDISNVHLLGKRVNLNIDIFDLDFSSIDRNAYCDKVISHLSSHRSVPKIVFLDPDTGIASGKPERTHVSVEEIGKIWQALAAKDMLLVYQHGARSKTWIEDRKKQFQSACPGASIITVRGPNISNDVAFFATRPKATA